MTHLHLNPPSQRHSPQPTHSHISSPLLPSLTNTNPIQSSLLSSFLLFFFHFPTLPTLLIHPPIIPHQKTIQKVIQNQAFPSPNSIPIQIKIHIYILAFFPISLAKKKFRFIKTQVVISSISLLRLAENKLNNTIVTLEV